ncbi:MAG: hypothetical protein A2383_04140 [Candidatus Pacebacteria bacterium RIFOXYB1_FULL_39_46]|nr:MAG: hypothetical protein A2383_04140 [Candidatus Pacebacteria bacterium RIFOXYB1_FULL_39_46]OGJ39145.1 MAG: hypothetical protein A2182_02385 [Candidatus Pacebacteria bacterium RIFOXYA1_FULL_38_18]OGJ40155.1 MAG: hypothetical protein A2582_03625 [Candidatus Pacebacteria bacterium RIFOXYD1_FULL_39_27]OGJ41040.1 MAG: hypothetical protein A2411_00975 [Candidatus Pacebacteria bacterium RIFOXYC1_FULL_39_21]
MKIKIIGTATTKFGELWDKSLEDLLREAVDGALRNANLEPKQIEAVFVANKAAGSYENQHHLNALVSQFFPHHPPAIRVEAACASGGLGIVTAEHALLADQYKTVLVVGVEKMSDLSASETTFILAGAADNTREYGSTFPALYALLAQSYEAKFGSQREYLSAVAVKNHRHALTNPQAQFHKEITAQQVAQSQLIADPLRLLDCSPISDGASAVILTTKQVSHKPQILGYGHAQDSLDLAGRSSLTTLAATTQAVEQALKKAKIKRSQLQVAEVHDCFTIAEILAIEDLGFFPKGQGGQATLDGETTIGGKIVINPSGGLKACGHPVGATGVKQIAFLAEQIQKGTYQYALAHNVGGSGATAVVHILGAS